MRTDWIARWVVTRQTSFRPTLQTILHLKPFMLQTLKREGNKIDTVSEGVSQHIFLWIHSANHLSLTAPPPPSFKRNPILNFFLSPNQDELHVIRANNVNNQLFLGSVHRMDMNARSGGHSSTRWPPSVCCNLQLTYWLFCRGQILTLWNALYLVTVVYRGGEGGLGFQTPPTEIPKFWQSWAEFPVPWKIHPLQPNTYPGFTHL
jgi:hypothetical protein